MKDYAEFTPETMRYTGAIEKPLMIDVPLTLEGISYRCTCLEYLGMGYCVMPFRRATKSLALNMGRMINESGYFEREICTVLTQIIDRQNIILEYCMNAEYENIHIKTLCEAAVKAMNMTGYTKPGVWVECNGRKMLIICKCI